jgi:ATP-dependent Clp protease adapter protein ClpS
MEKNLLQLIEEMHYSCLSGKMLPDRVVRSAYVSDLLSDVMGKAQPGMVWITSQVHKNIVAVASLKELSAVIVVNERHVDPEVLEHAEAEEVVILTSGLPAFETAGRLYQKLNEME